MKTKTEDPPTHSPGKMAEFGWHPPPSSRNVTWHQDHWILFVCTFGVFNCIECTNGSGLPGAADIFAWGWGEHCTNLVNCLSPAEVPWLMTFLYVVRRLFIEMPIKSSFEIHEYGDKPPDHSSLSWLVRTRELCTGILVSNLPVFKNSYHQRYFMLDIWKWTGV